MKRVFFFLSVLLVSSLSFAMERFPQSPDPNLTPGALCNDPDQYRYPEKIKYCERRVSSSTKGEVFRRYDQIGYRTREMKRQNFKVDHFIPLCMGGSNEVKNLWPQHQSVYRITDHLEAELCELMAEGKLLQREAIALLTKVKMDLSMAEEVEDAVESYE